MSTPVFRVNSAAEGELNAINIELWGFRDCPLVKPMAIARALQHLPPHQLEGLKKIAYDEKVFIPGLRRWIRLQGRSRHRGSYDHNEQTITLHKCSHREQLFHTLFHELGHFVYFRIISSFEKKQWVKEIYRQEPAVTPYGRRNAAEDFAEAYALYVRDPQRLSEFRLKCAYMRSIVFRDRPVDQLAVLDIVRGKLSLDPDTTLDQRV